MTQIEKCYSKKYKNMKTINVDIKDVLSTVSREDINSLDGKATEALDKVLNGTGAGNDFLGWVNHRHHRGSS